MKNDNLRKALEANRFYYAQICESMRPEYERIRIEQKRILSGVYREVAEMEARLRAIEEEFGYKYTHYMPSYPSKGDDGGGDDSGGDSGDNGGDAGGNSGNGDDSAGNDGDHYDPDEPRIPAGQPGGGQWTSGGTGDNNDFAQLAPLLEGAPVTPPLEAFPDSPTVSPGAGWEWRGSGDPESGQGNWYNPNTGESLHPDMDHGPPQGPHWDYWDPNGNEFRWYPDGTMEPKVVAGSITA